MDRLVPCSRCARHVRVDDEQCPFCKTAQGSCSAIATSRWALRLSLLGALAGSGSACEKAGESKAPPGAAEPAGGRTKTDVGAGAQRDVPSTSGAEPDSASGAEPDSVGEPAPPARIYGGPRTSGGDPSPSKVDDGDTIDEPQPAEMPKEIYGGPRMDLDDVPVPVPVE